MKTNSTNETPIYIQYARDVVEGRVVTGLYIKLACQNYLNYIDSDEYELRRDVVDRAIKFIGLLRHFRGTRQTTTNFILQPWQQWVVSAIVGVYHRGTNKRKHNNAYLEISRKNGKTALCAALALYFLIADGQEGAEVGCLANSREQAKICFEFCDVWSRQLDPSQRDLKSYRDRILLNLNHSKLIVCSAADDKLDGHGFTTAIVDEFHAAKTNKLRDVIKSSMVRENSLLLTITSAGFDKTGPCYKLRTTCIELLQGLKKDDSTFSAIYSLDDETDDWQDESVWVKSTPNLDVTVSLDYIRKQVASAINNPSEEVGVRTKTLGQWLSTSSVWIPDTYINKCTQTINLDDFNEDSECWVGCDLAAVGDMTAVTFMLFKEDDDTPYFHTKYYLPESALVESPNRELYKYWARTKQLTVCAGNVTDYDYITNDIMAMYNRFNVRKIAYDSWNSTQWAIKATELGLHLEPFSQSIGNFNKGTREFERLIRQGKCVIDNNEITRWMFRNVAIKTDQNGNIKPNKGAGAEKKIDGIISQITALGKWLETPRFSGSILAL